MITHFGIRMREKASNKINKQSYLSAKPEHMRGWTEEHYQRQILKAGLNYDLNMKFFSELSDDEFNKHVKYIAKKYRMKECFDLNEVDQVPGLYMIVLDEFKQLYVGQSENIKERIKSHWNGRKSLERLIYGDVCSSGLSIDSFGALDTTRIFYAKKRSNLYKAEQNIVDDLDGRFSLNRAAGGIGSAETHTDTKESATLAAMATRRKKNLASLVDVNELQSVLSEAGFKHYLEKYPEIRDKYFAKNPHLSIESLGLRIWQSNEISSK